MYIKVLLNVCRKFWFAVISENIQSLLANFELQKSVFEKRKKKNDYWREEDCGDAYLTEGFMQVY